MAREFEITPGRYVLAETDAAGARDPIGLLEQVAVMREMYSDGIGEAPALVLLVVDTADRAEVVRRITSALDSAAPTDADARITELREAITGALDALACTQYSQHAGGLSPREAWVKVHGLLGPHRIAKEEQSNG